MHIFGIVAHWKYYQMKDIYNSTWTTFEPSQLSKLTLGTNLNHCGLYGYRKLMPST